MSSPIKILVEEGVLYKVLDELDYSSIKSFVEAYPIIQEEPVIKERIRNYYHLSGDVRISRYYYNRGLDYVYTNLFTQCLY